MAEASDTQVQVNIIVHVGKYDLPTGGRSIYASGNHESLGQWKPDGLALQSSNSNYVGSIRVPASFSLELKLTQGTWDRVEVSHSGDNIPNRKIQCATNCSIDLYPEGFLDPSHPWEFEIRHFEDVDMQTPPPSHPVVFVGSSSIRLWSTLTTDFPLTAPLNRGFGGARISDLFLYYSRIISVYQPCQVVIYIGENDLINGMDPSQLIQLMRNFKESIRKDFPETRIYVTSIKPSPALWSKKTQIEQINSELKTWPTQDTKVTFVDIFDLMLNGQGQPRPELFLSDGLHMNQDGYAIWIHTFRKYFE